MAANEFATMLYRNTNKLTLILIYTFLEWVLIILLLLNSLFSYLIFKFADYFGLNPPCLSCSRIDHLFEHEKNKKLLRDCLCEAHATEISKLGFCSNHQKLAESLHMCEDCSSSRPDLRGVSENFSLFPWMKEIKLIQNGKEVILENGEVSLKCSCCGVNLESKFSSPYILIKPSWDDLAYTQKGNLVIETSDDDLMDKDDDFEQKRSDFALEKCANEEKIEDQVLTDDSMPICEAKELESNEADSVHLVLEDVQYKEEVMEDKDVQACVSEESSLEIPIQFHHLEYFVDCSGHRLVRVELIDSTAEEDQSKNQEFVVKNRTLEEDENGLFFHSEECYSEKEVYEQFDNTQWLQALSRDNVQVVADKRGDSDITPDEVSRMDVIETDGDVSIGTEIPDLDLADELRCEEALASYAHEEPSTSSVLFHEADHHGVKEDQESIVETKALSVEFGENAMNNQSSICSNLNEIEEDKVPETPTSIDIFHQLHKKLLLFEKKDSGNEEFLDGSVVSELGGGGDTVATVEYMKSALENERKALNVLYTELEEERSASAVAANQTMSMINRLQEEKAAMQMEALQYQRMMEEQAEYDQEALQLLNELMVKREKEKQELEKELEVYKKRVLEYEAKEKMKMIKRSKSHGSARSGFSSASCSNIDDSDGLSIDLNQEAKEDDSFYGDQGCGNQITQVDAFENLEESLADFEEERMAILEQLKILEEKLTSKDDDDAKHIEDVKPIEYSYEVNGNHTDFDGEINEHVNGFSMDMDERLHQDRRIVSVKGKGLLPLFDAMSDENGDDIHNGHENGTYMTEFDLENKNLVVEEELDHLHERLQALEADREFLKNCISSLKKGDKGMELLQEILQHLRDLRNVEYRAKSLSDGVIV